MIMKNIFAKFQEYVKKPKRNVFDLSFRNNLTLKFGQLTPVFCKEVIPGDSFKIHTKFGLQLMPMKFPVQTPMRAYVHYFYVRNRTLWKDWMDFIGGTKEGLTPPYVTPVDKEKFYRVGGLADYFGIPNVIYTTVDDDSGNSGAGASINFNLRSFDGFNVTYEVNDTDYQLYYAPFYSSQQIMNLSAARWLSMSDLQTISSDSGTINQVLNTIGNNIKSSILGHELWRYVWNIPTNVTQRQQQLGEIFNYENGNFVDGAYSIAFNPLFCLADVDLSDISYPIGTLKIHTNMTTLDAFLSLHWMAYGIYLDNNNRILDVLNIPLSFVDNDGKIDLSGVCDFGNVEGAKQLQIWFYTPFGGTTAFSEGAAYISLKDSGSLLVGDNVYRGVEFLYNESSSNGTGGVIGTGNLENTPYDSDIHLNALPFRAYEAIYNAYYRNPQNNPFILNGTPEYNRYNTTYEGGADTTSYDLYFRNWEYDFLTSAVQSPQQGIAPLVGMTMTGEATFADEEGNTYYAQAILNDEGEITGWQSHSSNMPVGSLRLLMDMAGTGISINDLRNVNAFQRFLENNIRHGLKYRDQLMSHFGVKVRYDELDMPEFIGGVSQSLDVNKLSQVSESGETPMGSFVGQASCLGESVHDITHYCDEHGFIIGIMSVVPVPVYSQLLPKFFVKSQQLDYYFPEFGHIGYQPIQQLEVSPLQTYYNGGDLRSVFGYNRAWYDYLASTDEVHGQFRTTMRDFIMNRTFEDEPELSEEFLLVDPDQLNDVFLAGTDDNDIYAPEADKIIGSMLFNVSAKRPIPLFGIPKLEG